MPDTEKLGKYTILEAIGSGGFATVYRAADPTLEREVALKVLRPDLLSDATFVRRFYQEARTSATLRHPHIITIFEVGEADGRLYIAMDLAAGTLAARLKEQGPLSWLDAMELLRDTARALDYAHGRGVIHRDLKPANILLDSFGQALISDFGVASLLRPELPEDGDVNDTEARDTVIGTPAYIAPEVWNGRRATAATDIYALACIAYELLSGHQLFAAPSKLDALAAHAAGPKFAPGWAGHPADEAEAVLRKALDRDPAKRHSSATELWRELKAADPNATQAVSAVLLPQPSAPVSDPLARPQEPSVPTLVSEPAPAVTAAPQTLATRVASLRGRPGCTLVVTLAMLLTIGGFGGFVALGGAQGMTGSPAAGASAAVATEAPVATPAQEVDATQAAQAAATSERRAQLTAEAAFNAGQISVLHTITAEAGVTQTADAAVLARLTAIAATEAAAASASAQPAVEAAASSIISAPAATSPPATSVRAAGPTRTPASAQPSPPSPTIAAAQQPSGAFINGGDGDYFTATVDGPVSGGGSSGSCISGKVRRSNGGLFQSFDVQISNGRETRRANANFSSGEYSICGLGADIWGVAVYAYDGFDVPSSEEAKHQVRLRTSGVDGEQFYVNFTARAGIVEPTPVPTAIPTATPFSRFDGTWRGELRGISSDASFSGRFDFVIKDGRLIYSGSSGASCGWEDYGLTVAVSEAGFSFGKRVAGDERIYYEARGTFSSANEATGTLYGDDGSGTPCIRDATWTARRTGS